MATLMKGITRIADSVQVQTPIESPGLTESASSGIINSATHSEVITDAAMATPIERSPLKQGGGPTKSIKSEGNAIAKAAQPAQRLPTKTNVAAMNAAQALAQQNAEMAKNEGATDIA